MAEKPVKDLRTCKGTCGDCYHFEATSDDDGECYLHPPVLYSDEEGYAFIRPVVRKTDRACSQLKGGS